MRQPLRLKHRSGKRRTDRAHAINPQLVHSAFEGAPSGSACRARPAPCCAGWRSRKAGCSVGSALTGMAARRRRAAPLSAHPGDADRLVQNSALRRHVAQRHEQLGRHQLDLADQERQAERHFVRRRRAVARRPPRHGIGDVDLGAVEPDGGEHAVEQLPGRARRRACPAGPPRVPGASPTSMISASGLPSAKTSWVARARSGDPSKASRRARKSSRLAAAAARARASSASASCAGAGGSRGRRRQGRSRRGRGGALALSSAWAAKRSTGWSFTPRSTPAAGYQSSSAAQSWSVISSFSPMLAVMSQRRGANPDRMVRRRPQRPPEASPPAGPARPKPWQGGPMSDEPVRENIRPTSSSSAPVRPASRPPSGSSRSPSTGRDVGHRGRKGGRDRRPHPLGRGDGPRRARRTHPRLARARRAGRPRRSTRTPSTS